MKRVLREAYMKIVILALIILMSSSQSFSAEPLPLTGNAADVYRRAQGGRWFADAAKLNPEITPTSDGQSFIVTWKAVGTAPKRWIVSLHGSRGFATDDLALWHPHIKNLGIGIVSIQWWIGTDDTNTAYYTPMQVYKEIDTALQKLGIQPGTVMFHGFSRGSANSYAVTALDAGRGRHYFSLSVASSGGVSLDYPPIRVILEGRFGDRPLRGTRWITVAGGKDSNSDRDGIAGMRRTAAWLKEQGATVIEAIEDTKEGHGALMLNPENVRHVLDIFLGERH